MERSTNETKTMDRDQLASLVGLRNSSVWCQECDPPTRVEVAARVFYRLKDEEAIACPNGHRGTVREYKDAANSAAVRHGPFIRLDGSRNNWLPFCSNE
jgi:hypothetical protein